MKNVIFMFFAMSITFHTVKGQSPFGLPSFYQVGPVWKSTIGDFNKDGKKDLAVCISYYQTNVDSVQIIFGNGDGTFPTDYHSSGFTGWFTTGTKYAVGNDPTDIISGDFNNDNILDLATVNSDSSISILIGKILGEFLPANNIMLPYLLARNITCSDVNDDGNVDILSHSWNTGGDKVVLLTGTGTGAFNSIELPSYGSGGTNVIGSDFNNDGHQDIIICGDGVSILLGNPNGGFLPLIHALNSEFVEDISISDYNKDGSPDLFTVGNYEQYISIFSWTAGSFSPPNKIFISTMGGVNILVNDFDGDNFDDILITTQNTTDKLRLYHGNGVGFINPISFADVVPGQLQISDLNGDGIQDLVTTNWFSDDISVYLNNSGMPNITSISPNPAYLGQNITVTGGFLNSTTGVSLDGVNIITPSFVSLNKVVFQSPTTISAAVTLSGSGFSVISQEVLTVTSFVSVSGLSIIPSSSTISGGDNQLFTANILPANATDKSVNWASSNTIVGIINSSGLFIGLSAGTTTITAVSVSNPSISDMIAVIVSPTTTTTSGGNCDPVHVSSISVTLGGYSIRTPVSVFVSGNYAYLSCLNSPALEIIDISNPATPILKSTFDNSTINGSYLHFPNSVYVSGNYAYLGENNGALDIFDISNPTAPKHVGRHEGNAQIRAVFVLGNYAYVVDDFFNTFDIIDISDPTSPVHKGGLTNGQGGAKLNKPYSIYVSGNYAYIASFDDSALEIIDISNPAAPVHKASLNDGAGGAILNKPYAVFVSGNYAYVASGYVTSGALEIVDVSNPASPAHKGSLINEAEGNNIDYTRSIYISGHFAYIPKRLSNSLNIVDISNPAAPVLKSSLTDGTGGAKLSGSRAVYVSGNHAYVVSTESNDLEIIYLPCEDLSNNFISIVNSGSQTKVVHGNTIVSWPVMAGVSTYCIQYSTDPTFTNNVVTVCGLTSTSYTITGLSSSSGRTNGQTIYWKVGAIDDATGAVYWSDVQNTSKVLQIESEISERLELYPNPASGTLNILGLKANDEILIYDVIGSLVMKANDPAINISTLANGLYVVKIGNKNLRFVKH